MTELEVPHLTRRALALLVAGAGVLPTLMAIFIATGSGYLLRTQVQSAAIALAGAWLLYVLGRVVADRPVGTRHALGSAAAVAWLVVAFVGFFLDDFIMTDV